MSESEVRPADGVYRRRLSVGATFTLAMLTACGTGDFSLGSRPRDGEPSSFEACGNGMDDDGDALVDEGCPCAGGESQLCFAGQYPNRLVGGCADGVQLCSAAGTREFGTWQECLGSQLPMAEHCGDPDSTSPDSIDDDCDGAIDEGCACASGALRACGFGTEVGPCSLGEQRCEAGIWSGCEGAIGPGPERCDDTVDNDCDGQVNEGCECIPSPEECGDGIDNDCDAVVDEPRGCGMCVGDTCTLDACACTWTLSEQVSLAPSPDVLFVQRSTNRDESMQLGRHESGVLARLYTGYVSGGGQQLRLMLDRSDGTSIVDQILATDARPLVAGTLDPVYLEAASVSPESAGFLVIYRRVSDVTGEPEQDLMMATHVDLSGSFSPPVSLGVGKPIAGLRAGDTLYVAWHEGAALWVGRFGLDFSPLGPAIQLSDRSPGRVDLVAVGQGIGVLSRDIDTNTLSLYVVDAEVSGLQSIALQLPEDRALSGRLTVSGSELVACWTPLSIGPTPLSFCRRAQLSPLSWQGDVFEAPSRWAVLAGCGLEFASATRYEGLSTDNRVGDLTHMHSPLASGGYESTAIAQFWGFGIHDTFQIGERELLWVSNSLDRSGLPFTGPWAVTLRCGDPSPPGDCEQANEIACITWDECCARTPDASQCRIWEGGVQAARDGDCINSPYFCTGDTSACLRDLEDTGAVCSDALGATPVTVVPASCILPADP